MNLSELTEQLRSLRGVRHKLDIQPVGALLRGRMSVPVGDDCAAIPDGDGHLLFAIEGLLDEFVEREPWFAGYCAVMVNVSDVYAMGGRPIAVVDAIWTKGTDRAGPIFDGMAAASAKYGVPIVGGHTNSRSDGDHLAAAVLGRAGKQLLTSFEARPGDVLMAAVDLRGEWFGPYPYWNASTTAPGDRLRADLELLPTLAENGLARAAKDISMGGIVGTATMLAECSGVGMQIDLSQIPKPTETPLAKWLTSFPSFGFLLAVTPDRAAAVIRAFESRGIAVATIGACDATQVVSLSDGVRGNGGGREVFWDLRREPFIGFAPTDRSGVQA